MTTKTISYQGEPGANSHIACANVYPDHQPVPCDTFEDAFAKVESGQTDLAMIPIENSVAGRVADIHHLLPRSDLNIVGEYFLPIHHQLLGLEGTRLEDLKSVHSHVHALGQCRNLIGELGLKAITEADTAGAARALAQEGNNTQAAISSSLAAQIYGLKVLRENIEDEDHNTTRFVVLAKNGAYAEKSNDPDNGDIVTSFVFRVRNVPAALYKAMGGFATNGVNMTKLESYQIDGQFSATQFYADIVGHPDDKSVQLAFEELGFFTDYLRILGVYKANPMRASLTNQAQNSN
ncbi:Prephenate dehydratase [hydrothermal vent metagenome]|uniref:prephenate dehydratase n=1 Tax=hydrothermal vent metagenome TaxID=652676 RepID=A0A3B0SLX7_9ZZZZ